MFIQYEWVCQISGALATIIIGEGGDDGR